MKNSLILLWLFLAVISVVPGLAQESAKEEDYFRIMRIPTPEGLVLEVGGLAVLPNGNLGVTTRRGDIFIVEDPLSAKPYFRKFASGLHEVLGLAYKNGALYCAQRGELTKMVDTDLDGKADLFETVYAWPISGNYHEYSFGPKLAPDGSFFVSTNLGFPDDWWRPRSFVPWRGWTIRITEDGRMEPWATGMRSPCGLGIIDGELFYADNQGDWIASGGIVHVKKGSFTGNPGGLRWTDMPNSPLKLKEDAIYTYVDPRIENDSEGRPVKPENIINEKFTTLFEMKKNIPQLQLPAVWLPHGVLGISLSEIVKIPGATFGPFAGQILIGDQGQSKIMRVFMEKVKGEYQGAVWDFRSGFQSGVLRMAWAQDGSLFVGETNRGWGSAGEANEGLQRLVWNGRLPFEMRTVRAMPDGFEIEFTKPVNKKSALDLASYSVESFTYKYHPVYGSPPVNMKKSNIKGVKVSEDGMTVRMIVDSLRQYYIHNITLEGLRENDNSYSLVHPTVYYTLNNIPDGSKLSLSEVSTHNSASTTQASAKAPSGGKNKVASKNSSTTKVSGKAPAYEEIKGLLVKNTCTACHDVGKKKVGPAFNDIAKRNYSDEKIVKLIYNPQPQNWPDYATPMAPMPQVPKEEALAIAAWINSLRANVP
jgi:cytochrome c551/c552